MNPNNNIPQRPELDRDSTLDLLFAAPAELDPEYNKIFYEHVQAGRSNDVLQLLTDNLVAVDAILDTHGNTALHLILDRDVEDLEEQYVAIAKHLVTKRCNWNIYNQDEKTALWLGISKGHVQVLVFQLEKKVRELTLNAFLEDVVCCMKSEDEKIRENAVYTVSTIFEEVESISYATGIEATMQGRLIPFLRQYFITPKFDPFPNLLVLTSRFISITGGYLH